MGKRAITPCRIAEYIQRFNREKFSLKIYLRMDEKYTHVCSKADNIILLSAKHEYIEELITAISFMYRAGYYCSFGIKNVIQSDYYKSKHNGITSYKSLIQWKTNFQNLNPL